MSISVKTNINSHGHTVIKLSNLNHLFRVFSTFLVVVSCVLFFPLLSVLEGRCH